MNPLVRLIYGIFGFFMMLFTGLLLLLIFSPFLIGGLLIAAIVIIVLIILSMVALFFAFLSRISGRRRRIIIGRVGTGSRQENQHSGSRKPSTGKTRASTDDNIYDIRINRSEEQNVDDTSKGKD